MTRRLEGARSRGPFVLLVGLLTVWWVLAPSAVAGQAGQKKSTKAHHAKATTKGTTPCGPHCGTERWSVKTLTDADAGKVNFTPVTKTVADLTGIAAPTQSSDNSRLNDTEKQVFKVHARLVGYKEEYDPTAKTNQGDHDFHIVIADLQNPTTTMIVEIPDPTCGGVCSSPRLAEIKQARENFAATMTNPAPTKDFVVVQGNVEVEVSGVAFFDFYHGQTGVAQHCIELHPVLGFDFVTPGPYQAKKDPAAQPKGHPKSWYSCIPQSRAPSATGSKK